MRNTGYFLNKKVTIVGLARSGVACANLLHEMGACVSVSELQDNPSIRRSVAKLASGLAQVELGRHTRDFIAGRDLIVVSPGVTTQSPALVWAREAGIPIMSEIEAAWILCPATVVAVTGSGGKSTVTTLIGKAIDASGKKAFMCGNIGNPFSGEVARMSCDDYVSLEVSSFQLETIRAFKPKIAVMLNFNRNHLDRHKDMQEYLDAKKRIFLNQDQQDYLVLNMHDPVLKFLAHEAKSQVRFFSGQEGLNPNHEAVMAVGAILGITQELCMKVFSEFKGLEHRLEYVAQINNIRFINDSKATLAESTMWAIRSIASPIILIAGGRDKRVEYQRILEAARNKVKEVILIGEAKEKIRDALEGFLKTDEAATLDEAVRKAYAHASAGDTVVLSPMCSSFDMFENYEERGRAFKHAVFDLVKK